MGNDNALSAFERFRLSDEELKRFRSEFAPAVDSTYLARTPELKNVVIKYDKVSGVYFWTAVLRAAEFKIYAGKTNSPGYRLTNYTAPFQPHSPNDYKLLVFGAFLQELAPGSALRCYFKKVDVPKLRAEENLAALIGWLLVEETVRPQVWLGALVIFAACWWVARTGRQPSRIPPAL